MRSHAAVRSMFLLPCIAVVLMMLAWLCTKSVLYADDTAPRHEPVVQTAPLPVSARSIIVYRAYLDNSEEGHPWIRVLAFAQCATAADESEKNQLKIHIDEVAIAAVPTPIEGSCPWHWAPRCEWNSFIYELEGFSLARNGRIPASVAVSRRGYTTLLPLSQSVAGITGLSICVPPLYWFADWLRLIEFLETWIVLGASHFYVYFQSVSSVVHAVLRDYERRGIVTLIRWQETPSSAEEDPNKSIYRLGHSLAHNDCLMRTTSKYVALVDVDEVIYVEGTKNLVSFLDAQLNLSPLAGSFRFQHYRVHFPQREIPRSATLDWRAMDFSWVPEAKAVSGEGPTKAIFIAERTQITLTHRVLRHREPFQEIMVPTREGVLLHARTNWVHMTPAPVSNDRHSRARLLATNEPNVSDLFDESLRRNVLAGYRATMERVTRNADLNVTLNTDVPQLVQQCLSRWKLVGCKTPFHSCRGALENAEDWRYSNEPGHSTAYIVL